MCPAGSGLGLVGPNGAGKTTLIRLLVGLRAPSAGQALVLGRQPRQSEEFLASVGYLAQEAPLYKRLTADEHLDLGAHLNLRWDKVVATDRLRALQIPLDRPVGTLSGGQRSQVALGLALAKRPEVLLLDEPVAALDPLARRAFLSSLAEAVAGGELTVVLSSHLLHDSNECATTLSCSPHLEPSSAMTSRLCLSRTNALSGPGVTLPIQAPLSTW